MSPLHVSHLFLNPSHHEETVSPNGGPTKARKQLYNRFASRIQVNENLSRRLVSYQGNKDVAGFRWMKYKEGFSAQLVKTILDNTEGRSILDPFSGGGTTVLTAIGNARRATGVEIMPVGNLVARAIVATANGLGLESLTVAATAILACISDKKHHDRFRFPYLAITAGAFSHQTECDLAKARAFIDRIPDRRIKTVLEFACISVLEEVSYTRKDGQYLRWDYRSVRPRKIVSKRLNKGAIPSLVVALRNRLRQIAEDAPALKSKYEGASPDLIDGSSLDELRKMQSCSFDIVVTSPPYANRYDYTRTYALELAYLGYDDKRLKALRQAMLSATVENRSKRTLLQND